jgi:hypothetical protein
MMGTDRATRANWGGPVGDHRFDRLEHDRDGRYVVICTCGWSSSADTSAEAVGHEWDVHRELASARNGA